MSSGKERMRELVEGIPEESHWREKARQGWSLVALEWERESERDEAAALGREEVPYGLRVAGDCLHLEEAPEERKALTLMLELLIADKKLSEVAAEVNERGYRTRKGEQWTPLDVFNLFPRLIEVAPDIYPSADWEEVRRRGLIRAAG